jgi:phospholipid/cholesterol/gamma-HCH transport system substrate-binding protein
MNPRMRALKLCSALGSSVLLTAACSFGGLNSLNLPGTVGHGPGSFTITVELPDVSTLPQNSPVLVDDVTVGSVSGQQVMQRPDGTFYAALRLSLSREVQLPANATVTIGQTSLLGSQHVELRAPTTEPPVSESSPTEPSSPTAARGATPRPRRCYRASEYS